MKAPGVPSGTMGRLAITRFSNASRAGSDAMRRQIKRPLGLPAENTSDVRPPTGHLQLHERPETIQAAKRNDKPQAYATSPASSKDSSLKRAKTNFGRCSATISTYSCSPTTRNDVIDP